MRAIEIRNKFLNFFINNEHNVIQGAKLIPENDPTVLFTTAGMQQLVPYLVGEHHPLGRRLVDYQKCLRTGDIEEVGDNRHLTFFEMLGNWSLGDYFKTTSIGYSFEFLTKHLNIPIEKLSVTCFEGDEDAPRDEESAKAWEEVGIPKNKIYFFGKSENWWEPGGFNVPCGPDTEIFYDTGKEACCDSCNPSCDCGKYVEIWNNVFMEYKKTTEGYIPLSQKNVDTGMGIERITFLLQGKNDLFETELFSPVIEKLQMLSKNDFPVSLRIIADHLRSTAMLIIDGIRPANVDQGYILRRLIRRTIRHVRKLGIEDSKILEVIDTLIDTQKEMYPELLENKDIIKYEIEKEKNKFMTTLIKGEAEFEKVLQKLKQENKTVVDGKELFRLYDTFGFPPEVTSELAKESGFDVDKEEFDVLFKHHQELSRQGASGKFKGGMADDSQKTINYHTATHLLHAALRKVLGEHVLQRGSNITSERMRFDFSNPEKVTKEQLQQVEDLVNEQIQRDLQVSCEEKTLTSAKEDGAMGIFESKYGELVKVYSIGDFSKEICGGPHAAHTGELGKFKIQKEEAVSSGVRRIKAILIEEE